MPAEYLIRISFVAILLIIATYYIFSLGKLAWFDPYKLEKILSERARQHSLNAYNPKYNWKVIILMARVFSLVGALVLLTLVIEILSGLIGLTK